MGHVYKGSKGVVLKKIITEHSADSHAVETIGPIGNSRTV
jgi:hypothetical protein